MVLKSSLANMGFSETKCLSTSMVQGNFLELGCQTGQITELVDWGILSKFDD